MNPSGISDRISGPDFAVTLQTKLWRWAAIFPHGLSSEESSYWLSNWWYTYPSEKYESQLGYYSILFPIYGKINNVPNHQPAIDCLDCDDMWWYVMIRWSMWLLTNIEVIIFTWSDNVRHMWIISLNYTISFVKFGFEGQTGVPRLISSTLGFTVSTDSSYPTVFAAGHIGLIHAVVVVRPQWAFGGFNPTGFWVHLRLICRFHAQSSVASIDIFCRDVWNHPKNCNMNLSCPTLSRTWVSLPAQDFPGPLRPQGLGKNHYLQQRKWPPPIRARGASDAWRMTYHTWLLCSLCQIFGSGHRPTMTMHATMRLAARVSTLTIR